MYWSIKIILIYNEWNINCHLKPNLAIKYLLNYFRLDLYSIRILIYYSDGGKYTGDWFNGKRHGKGTFYYTGGDRYEGEFNEDSKTGKGTYYFSNGNKYVGDFINGNFNGQGNYYWVNGDRYKCNIFIFVNQKSEFHSLVSCLVNHRNWYDLELWHQMSATNLQCTMYVFYVLLCFLLHAIIVSLNWIKYKFRIRLSLFYREN